MTEIFDQENITSLQTLLTSIKKAVVVTHTNPDGDAIGSSLGWAYFLKQQNIDTTVIVPNRFPDFLKWIDGSNDIVVYNEQQEKAKTILQQADVVFCLDFNTLSRIDELGKLIEEQGVKRVLIDHHLDPSPDFVLSFSHIPASSTCELVYRLIISLTGSSKIDKPAAEAIYTGIVTDTGLFSYASSNPELFLLVADLMACGISRDEIHASIYDNFSVERIRLLGYTLSERMVVLPQYNAAYIYLTKDELLRFHFQQGDTEGFVNIPLTIKNIKVSAFFVEGTDHIKISLRSKGEFSVNLLARKHFNGGGHKNASGGKVFMSLQECVKLFETSLEDYKDELLNLKSFIIIFALSVMAFTSCNSSDFQLKQPENKGNLLIDHEQEKLIDINKFLTDKDRDVIESYIRRQGWKMTYSPQGYYYEVYNEGDKPLIVDGNQVEYYYSVRLLNGTLCYKSEDDKPADFLVGRSEDIIGLHQAVKRLGKGGRAKFIFPPGMAHGLQGDGDKIPPRAILLYDVTINDVK